MRTKGKVGLAALVGRRVVLWCASYIYAGTLKAVGKDDILLDDAHVVYETGVLRCAEHKSAESLEKKFKDAQALPGPWYVRLGAIESYGEVEH